MLNVPVSLLYLLLHVQQGLPVRLQHGVQAGAEGPQVTAVEPRLIGVVLLVDDNTVKEQVGFRTCTTLLAETEAFHKKTHHLFNSSITDIGICYQYQMSTLLVKYVPTPWHLYQLYCICMYMTILFCLFTLFYKNMLRNVVQIADKYRKIKTKLKVIL